MRRSSLVVLLGVLAFVSNAGDISDEDAAAAIAEGAAHILAMEEGPDRGEWPYQGVYRVGDKIPVGYRVGGTGISCLAMALTPGYEHDAERQGAVRRGVEFVINATGHELMDPDYGGGYDVRGWGHIYGGLLLIELQRRGFVPDDLEEKAKDAAAFYVEALQRTDIPEVGGWNYARQTIDAVSPPSTFMTASALQMLFLAREAGYEVDDAVVERALEYLGSARHDSGEFVYAGDARRAGGVPGATGRMLICETTLHLAGRSSVRDVRGALDAFFTHWEWLEQRRAKTGTHQPPYGVAPYYFYFAHYYAAQAIETLPMRERSEYRRKHREVLFSTRDEGGTWNDRVFERSANYGTAMSIMGLHMAEIGLPARWTPDKPEIDQP